MKARGREGGEGREREGGGKKGRDREGAMEQVGERTRHWGKEDKAGKVKVELQGEGMSGVVGGVP